VGWDWGQTTKEQREGDHVCKRRLPSLGVDTESPHPSPRMQGCRTQLHSDRRREGTDSPHSHRFGRDAPDIQARPTEASPLLDTGGLAESAGIQSTCHWFSNDLIGAKDIAMDSRPMPSKCPPAVSLLGCCNAQTRWAY
jgi:hypothetical protein